MLDLTALRKRLVTKHVDLGGHPADAGRVLLRAGWRGGYAALTPDEARVLAIDLQRMADEAERRPAAREVG